MDAFGTPPLRESWYYALPSAELKPGKTLGKTLLGEPVLLGRDAEGKAFALVDICPHRGIPLRYGKFDGQTVECCYHGWRFAPSGACTEIPVLNPEQQPEAQKIKVGTYPVQEIQGGLWVFFGTDPASAPPPPVLPEIGEVAPRLVERMSFAASIDHAVIGLMDPAHGAYIHQSWFWRSSRKIRDKHKQFAPSDHGFTMVRHAPSSNSRAYKILGGKPETEISFRLPGVRTEHIRVGEHRMCHLTTVTPITDKETEIHHSIFWTMPWLTPFKPLFRPFVRTFLRQDRDAVERQQEGLAHDPSLMLLGDPDQQAKWYLRLKLEYNRAREEGRPFQNPVKERVLHWRS